MISRISIAVVLITVPMTALAGPPAINRDVLGDRDVALHRASVVGKDQRRLLPRMVEQEFRGAADSVGLLFQINGPACTAFCVSPDIIATNAHCLANKKRGKHSINLNQVLFRLAPSHKYIRQRLTRLKIADPKQPIASIFTGITNGRYSTATLHRDWALAKLRKSVCANYSVDLHDASKREIIAAARAKKLFLIGYHGDKKMTDKWMAGTCSIVAGKRARRFGNRSGNAQSHLLLHTCDATRGASGSPIFMETQDGHAVVAINSGHVYYSKYRRNRNTGKRKVLASGLANTSVKISAFIGGLERFRNEDSVRSTGEVRRLQELLRQGGFLKGRADGQFGPQTRRAIHGYEKRRKLAPLGLPTLALLYELEQRQRATPQDR